jgi:uncharacterized protein YtpQ (UPF0354 family)
LKNHDITYILAVSKLSANWVIKGKIRSAANPKGDTLICADINANTGYIAAATISKYK